MGKVNRVDEMLGHALVELSMMQSDRDDLRTALDEIVEKGEKHHYAPTLSTATADGMLCNVIDMAKKALEFSRRRAGSAETGGEKAGTDCSECDGDGFVLADCFEDTCCCADPELQHDWIPCPLCGGRELARLREANDSATNPRAPGAASPELLPTQRDKEKE